MKGSVEAIAIHVPDEIRRMLNRTPEEMARDVRLYAALMLFRLGKLSSGAAARDGRRFHDHYSWICVRNMTFRYRRSRSTT